jgi:hypothetical protein
MSEEEEILKAVFETPTTSTEMLVHEDEWAKIRERLLKSKTNGEVDAHAIIEGQK